MSYLHGHATGKTKSPTWLSWLCMWRRCTVASRWDFKFYGGRGVKICDRWRVFANFLADMGERPAGTSLDRIDFDGNYEPDNCRWATRVQQQNNRRSNRLVTCGGVTATLAEWSRRTGLGRQLIAARLGYGWSPERALSQPIRTWPRAV